MRAFANSQSGTFRAGDRFAATDVTTEVLFMSGIDCHAFDDATTAMASPISVSYAQATQGILSRFELAKYADVERA